MVVRNSISTELRPKDTPEVSHPDPSPVNDEVAEDIEIYRLVGEDTLTMSQIYHRVKWNSLERVRKVVKRLVDQGQLSVENHFGTQLFKKAN